MGQSPLKKNVITHTLNVDTEHLPTPNDTHKPVWRVSNLKDVTDQPRTSALPFLTVYEIVKKNHKI